MKNIKDFYKRPAVRRWIKAGNVQKSEDGRLFTVLNGTKVELVKESGGYRVIKVDQSSEQDE